MRATTKTLFRLEDAIAVWKEEGREEGIELLAKLLRKGIPLEAALEQARKHAH